MTISKIKCMLPSTDIFASAKIVDTKKKTAKIISNAKSMSEIILNDKLVFICPIYLLLFYLVFGG